jgi:PIN domain nuclease of toxin-antitoxin system
LVSDRPILLDTCAALWLTGGGLKTKAVDELKAARSADVSVLVSPITAWEVGNLIAKRRVVLTMPTLIWFETLIDSDVTRAELSPAILVAATELNAPDLRDPADRIVAATARALNLRLMTRDRPLLDFAATGQMSAIPC